MLNEITPLLLTYNEAPNIGRTLSRLEWARDIVVVDSFSDDDTIAIARGFPQVRVFQRRFDSHGAQWNFGLTQTGITSEWVLALDADYVLSAQLVDEMKHLKPDIKVAGLETTFRYCIYGKALRGTVYPPVTTLFRRAKAYYEQDGHTQRVRVDGKVERLRGIISHDDRKALSQWCASQNRYMALEAAKLEAADPQDLPFTDRLRRRIFIAPWLVFFYCAFAKGNILDGRAGLYYAFQRTVAELLLSLHLLELRISREKPD